MTVLERQALHRVRLTLNGVPREGQAQPRTLLSDFLRHTRSWWLLCRQTDCRP